MLSVVPAWGVNRDFFALGETLPRPGSCDIENGEMESHD